MSSELKLPVVDIDKMWSSVQVDNPNIAALDPKIVFVRGVETGLRIVLLMNKTFDIKDLEEQMDAEDRVWEHIDSVMNQVAAFLLKAGQ